MDWAWVAREVPRILGLLGQHVVLAMLPVLCALVLAIPLGWLVHRAGPAAGAVLAVLSTVYAIPSLAMFVLLPLLLGTRILNPINIVVALTIYTLVLLVRSVVDGLRSVPAEVRQAATAVGYGPAKRLVAVELPLAMPVVLAGLRVAGVANIALVSVGAVIGLGALGDLFDQGLRQGFLTPVVVGIVLIVALALLFDGLVLLIQRLALPWYREAR